MDGGNVIWVRIEKPVFDLVGIFVASFSLTAICILVALGCGALWGTWLLRRNRRPELSATQLDLQPQPRA
jgi:hypothetical protein